MQRDPVCDKNHPESIEATHTTNQMSSLWPLSLKDTSHTFQVDMPHLRLVPLDFSYGSHTHLGNTMILFSGLKTPPVRDLLFSAKCLGI